jgi:hypothetical protein
MDLVERANSTFTKRELERLMAYRAAVAAGFYNDWDGLAEPVEADTVAPAEAGATPEQPAC